MQPAPCRPRPRPPSSAGETGEIARRTARVEIEPERDRVHPDAGRPVVDRQRPGQALDRRLRRRVRQAARTARCAWCDDTLTIAPPAPAARNGGRRPRCRRPPGAGSARSGRAPRRPGRRAPTASRNTAALLTQPASGAARARRPRRHAARRRRRPPPRRRASRWPGRGRRSPPAAPSAAQARGDRPADAARRAGHHDTAPGAVTVPGFRAPVPARAPAPTSSSRSSCRNACASRALPASRPRLRSRNAQ